MLSLNVYLALYLKPAIGFSLQESELASYTGIGLTDGETVRAISAIVSTHEGTEPSDTPRGRAADSDRSS